MTNFLIKKSIREELERRGITYRQYQLEQAAAKHPERYTRDAEGNLRAKAYAEMAAESHQRDIEQAAARNPERFTTGDDGKLRPKTTDEVAAERRARREGTSPEEALAQVQAAPVQPPRVARPVARFPYLGVQVMDNGDVHTFSGFGKGTRLGLVAGAHAEMAAERKKHRVGGAVAFTAVTAPVLGPVGLVGALGKKSKASSFVVLADGTLHERKHDGNSAVTSAQREVVKFNAAVVKYGQEQNE